MQRITAFLQLAMIAMLAACSHANVQTTESYLGPPVARPDRILVARFALSPDQVSLDQGIGPRIMRAAGNQPAGTQELQAIQDTQDALAERLVERLNKYGLHAEPATTETGDQHGLLLQGQITSINQGNRTRRVLIGLGAGKSSIGADAQLYALSANAPPRFMTAFQGKADSGNAPGAAETMGAGAVGQRMATSTALTGVTHASAEKRRTTDTAEATALADKIAFRIGQFGVAQGWIPPTALK